MEEAWRRRHRWAALRLAPLQTDLYDSPPLAPLYARLATLSLSIALMLDANDAALAASDAAWLASGVDTSVCLWASMAAGGKVEAEPSPQQQQPASAAGKVLDGARSQHMHVSINGDALASAASSPWAAGSSPRGTSGNNSQQDSDSPSRPGAVRDGHHFIPSSFEEFETSRLPTIRSRTELESANAVLTANPAAAGRMPASPFETAASMPGPDEGLSDGGPAQGLVAFSSGELKQLDVARGHMSEEVWALCIHYKRTLLCA